MAANGIDEQEVSALALHLLQVSLVYMKTCMLQTVLAEPSWGGRMTLEDYRCLDRRPMLTSIPTAGSISIWIAGFISVKPLPEPRCRMRIAKLRSKVSILVGSFVIGAAAM